LVPKSSTNQQVGFDDLKFHGLRYGGILLWSLDCALQALLVVAYTRNLKKSLGCRLKG